MISKQLSLLCIALFLCSTAHAPKHTTDREQPIAVVVPSYNNALWCVKNIDSLLSQNYSNYHIYYYDDCSTDATYACVTEYVKKHNARNKVTIVHNPTRRGALANIYRCIHSLENNVIVLTVDGDDWLAHNNVFAKVNEVYQTTGAHMTYGQFIEWPHNRHGFCTNVPHEIMKTNNYRSYAWVTSHMRTFRAGLFKQIKLQDLMYEGSFFPVTWDMAFMFPLLELSGGSSAFIDEVLYMYNCNNPINDFRIACGKQNAYGAMIRGWQRYQPLTKQELEAVCSVQPQNVSYCALILSEDPTKIIKTLASLNNTINNNSIVVLYPHGKDAAYDILNRAWPACTYMPIKNGTWSETIKELVNTNNHPFTILLSDEDIVDSALFVQNAHALLQTKASAAFVRETYTNLKPNITRSEQLSNTLYAWQQRYGNDTAGQPFRPGVMFHTSSLAKTIPTKTSITSHDWWNNFAHSTIQKNEVLIASNQQ